MSEPTPQASPVPPAPPGLPPRGWYLDPKLAPRERWWTGTEWSDFTHRKASSVLFGPDYQRLFWPGPNRFATRSWIFTLVTIGLYAVAFITGALVNPGTGSQPSIWPWVVVCVGGTGLAVVGIFVGFMGGVFGLFFVGFGVVAILGTTGRL